MQRRDQLVTRARSRAKDMTESLLAIPKHVPGGKMGPHKGTQVLLSSSPYPGRKQPRMDHQVSHKQHPMDHLVLSTTDTLESKSALSLAEPSTVSFSLRTDIELYGDEELPSSPTLTSVDKARMSTEEITLTNWVNDRLNTKTGRSTFRGAANLLRVTNLSEDLRDGVILVKLLENLTKKKIKGYEKNPKITAHKMVNLDLAFQFLAREGIKVTGIGSHNIFNGDLKLILGLVWTLVQKYQLRILGTHVSTKKVITQWVQALLPSWNISNLTSDWSNGCALVALINEVKPGVAPDVSTLDVTKRRSNCIQGLKIAHNHLKIPKLISPDDLANSSIDEMSMMTYISYFVEPAKARLLKWLKKQIPQMTITNFTNDWSDGRALTFLLESRFPGILQSLSDDKQRERTEIIGSVYDVCQKRLGIEPLFTAGQLAKVEVEELQVMTYVLRIKTAKLKALPDEIRVTGEGIKKATTLKAATFEIDTTEAGPGTLSIDASYENGDRVKFSFNEISPAVAQLTYTPPHSGIIEFDILWSNTPIPNSPFTVSVTDSTLVRFIDFERHSRLGRVNIPISLSLTTKNAGPGSLSASLDYTDGTQVRPTISKEPDHVLTLKYVPPKPGKPSLRVFWNGEELKHLSIPYTIVDSGNYRVVERPEKKIYRTFESSLFVVESDGAPLDVLQMTAFFDEIQIPIRFKSINGLRGEASFTPTLPGVYRVEVACVDRLVEGSPFRVEVTDPSRCKPIGLLPKYLQLGAPYKFEVDMKDAGVGTLDFVSADGDSSLPFNSVALPLTKKGVQVIEVTPQKSGEYLVGIQFHGAFIPSSPFRVRVCDPNKCRVSGDISKKTALVGKPVQFNVTVMGQDEGIKPTVKAVGPSAKYSAEIRTTDNHTYAVQFTPWEMGTHEITVQYGGYHIPKSPFLLAVGGFDSDGISATGSGLQEAFTGIPAQFVVVAKEEGLLDDGTLKIKVTGVVNNVECRVRARDNQNGTYNVAYLTQTPGAYLVTILAGDQHIPGSPFRLSASLGPSPENCYMYGPALEPTNVLTIGKPIDFTVNTSDGGTGSLSVKAVGPGGAEARVYIAEGEKKHTHDIMLDPIRHGKYRVSVKWSGKHVQGSPFILKIFPGADASKCRAFGPGLEDGYVGKASSFTIETRDAGAGTLKVRLHGVRDAFKIDIKPIDQRNVRTLIANYDPRKPGEYLVTIKWSENNIPGSPFRVKIEGDALTEKDIEDWKQRATPREALPSINEEGSDEEQTQEEEETDKKRAKKSKHKSKRPVVQVLPVILADPRSAMFYQNRSNHYRSGGVHTVSGAGPRLNNPHNMRTFNGLRSERPGRHGRSSTAPPRSASGEYHGQATLQMNTYTHRQLREMKRSQSAGSSKLQK